MLLGGHCTAATLSEEIHKVLENPLQVYIYMNTEVGGFVWEKRSGKETEGTKIEKYEEERNRKKEARSDYGRRN